MLYLHDFTGIYKKQNFYIPYDNTMYDYTSIEGVRGYMSDEARAYILNDIKGSLRAVHFLDSGNYHHLSRIYLDLISEKFNLIVYDNHTDMQFSAFGNILSCGSWIADAYQTSEKLKEIFIIGARADYIENCEFNNEKRVHFLKSIRGVSLNSLPIYLSIDKDVLSTDVFIADWDQGSMSLENLIKEIKIIKNNHNIIGVDICGEPAPENERNVFLSNNVNKELCNALKGYI